MAFDKAQLIELAKANAKASLNPSSSYSFGDQKLSADALNDTFVQQLNELSKDFRENQNTIYTLMEVSLTEVLPKKVMQEYGQFADVRTVGLGEKPVFKVNVSEASKKRAKQFVTRVGLAGRYETFKLDGYSFEIGTGAYGGAARVEWEEILAGRFTMNDYYSLVLEGLDDKVYEEIAKALESMIDSIGIYNKAATSTFDEATFDNLLATAKVYGQPTIYCTFEFAATMLPITADWYSDSMKQERWNKGYFANYKGNNVVILPQSFTDETNATKVIDPSLCWIIPTGADKPVKVAFEGSAQVKQFENRDWSTEIQTYQKFGVGTYLVNPGICVYKNKTLTRANVAPGWVVP